MSAKLELSLRGLLKHCEDAAEEDNTDYRLKKYVATLSQMFSELEMFDDVDLKALSKYKSRINDLKQLINYKEPPRDVKKDNLEFTDVIREIRTIKNARLAHETRKELLEGGLRQRTSTTEGNLEQATKHYENLQEKIAEDMLTFTRALKEQTATANEIIRKDTEKMQNSSKLTDRNMDKLKDESQKLQDHSKGAWKCWMWLMIAVVVAIFLFMVLFMRVTKKRTS